jgi:[methyl-Co(III) methanol-specific corrinoid protein]:coenzyme M methyltransferase
MLVGMTEFSLLLVTDIDVVNVALKALIELSVDYADSLVKAGADVVVIEDMVASIVSPAMCRTVILPIWKQLQAKIQAVTVLHVCGDATSHLEMMVESGVDAISIEKKTRLERAVELTREKAAVIGNISPTVTLFMGDTRAVEREAEKAIKGGVDLLAPGCSLAPGTPLKNIRAMVKAAKIYGHKS